MGSRVTLYNMTQAIPSPYCWPDHAANIPQNILENLPALKWAEIAETNNTGIPIPWMLYFGLDDFHTTSITDGDGNTDLFPMPFTSVERARQRILTTLPMFERIAGDTLIAKEYWQEAIDVLERLPFPYLSMDHLEGLGGDVGDPAEAAEEFRMGYETGSPDDNFLMGYSDYAENVTPYSREEWSRLVTRFDWSNERQMNAIAMGYGHARYSTLYVYEGVGGQSRSYKIEC